MTDQNAASPTGALDEQAKKTVLRMVSYGLYAVGAASGEDRNMFTANWFTQVSFDPPLVALSVENDSHSIGLIRQSKVFSVCILGQDQRDLAGVLGKRWKLRPDKITQVPYRLGETGVPILDSALGAIECRVTQEVPAGDSAVFLAQVVHAVVQREGTPLTMQAAGFKHAG